MRKLSKFKGWCFKECWQKWGQTDTKWTNTKGRPPFHREIPELTSKFQPQHIYSCTITVCSWNYLAGPTHSHMRVYYLRRTHTLQRQLYARGERGEGGENSRAQDDSTLWVEALVLQAALQHSVIIILSVQPDWGQTERNQRGRGRTEVKVKAFTVWPCEDDKRQK